MNIQMCHAAEDTYIITKKNANMPLSAGKACAPHCKRTYVVTDQASNCKYCEPRAWLSCWLKVPQAGFGHSYREGFWLTASEAVLRLVGCACHSAAARTMFACHTDLRSGSSVTCDLCLTMILA